MTNGTPKQVKLLAFLERLAAERGLQLDTNEIATLAQIGNLAMEPASIAQEHHKVTRAQHGAHTERHNATVPSTLTLGA